MAMAWLWTGMVAVSLIFGALTGNLNALSAAALEGAQNLKLIDRLALGGRG